MTKISPPDHAAPDRPRASIKLRTRRQVALQRLLRRNEDEASLLFEIHAQLLVDISSRRLSILQFGAFRMHVSAYYFGCQPPEWALAKNVLISWSCPQSRVGPREAWRESEDALPARYSNGRWYMVQQDFGPQVEIRLSENSTARIKRNVGLGIEIDAARQDAPQVLHRLLIAGHRAHIALRDNSLHMVLWCRLEPDRKAVHQKQI